MNDLCRWSDRPFGYLWYYVSRRRLAHGVIFAAVITAVICSVSTQYGVKFLVDSLTSNSASPWIAFGLLAGLIAADNLSWRLASWIASRTFVQVTGDVRRDLFRHLTRHSHSYFAQSQPGILTSRITATSNATFAIENMFIWNVMPPCLATLCSFGFLASVNIAISLCLMLVAGVMVICLFRLAMKGRPLHHDFARKAATVDGEMVDVIGNLSLVKAFGGLIREHARFDRTVGRELSARTRSLRYLERLRLIHAATTVVLTIGILAWVLMLRAEGRASIGDVVMVSTLGLGVLSATRDLAVALVDVTQHMARFAEAIQTLLLPHQMQDHPQATALTHQCADIVLANVSFRYPKGERIFSDFSLHIAAGERVGLVGPSGSGKSTLFALLQRFYDLDEGRILIDGHDLRQITQESLWSAIATVPQDTALFNRSLLENIRYGRPEAADEEVRKAALAARCNSFIEALPDGLRTIVGDRGLRLSGGQRQRISIARAFLKNAPILLLDEATSALDPDSEEAVRDALSRLMAGRTVIAVAHRLSTLQNFDRIVVLGNGRVMEDGRPSELIARNGHYGRLVRKEAGMLARQVA